MFKNLGIKTKIALTTGIAVLTVSILIVVVLYSMGSKAAITNHFSRVEIVKDAKKIDIESHFDLLGRKLRTFSNNITIIEGFGKLKEAFNRVEIDTKEKEFRKNKQAVYDFYKKEFLQILKDSMKVTPEWGKLVPGDPKTIYFQFKYLLGNKGSSEINENTGEYDTHHEKYHSYFKNYAGINGIKDIYFVDLSSGHVIYSVFKKIDFATNLISGSFKESKIASVTKKVKESGSKDRVIFDDCELYLPNFYTPSMFAGIPVFNKQERLGVLIFELSMDEINNIVTGNQNWVAEGLQKGGETYLVGNDYKMKTNSRLLFEDPERFFNEIVGNRVLADQIKTYNNTTQLFEVKNEAVTEALKGNSNNVEVENNGKVYLSSYSPIKVDGLNWVIVSEFSLSEALGNVQIIVIILSVVLFVFLLFALWLSMPLGNSLAQPILRLAREIEEISKGDLTVDVKVDSRDEVGQTASSIKRMIQKLNEVIGDVISAADSISQASREMNSSSQQMSEGATQQASSAEEISASMEEMAANIQQNTDNAQETEKIAERSSEEIINGSKSAIETVNSMKTIVGKISIIGEISRQTNLLAINAAVESVKKGEFGRGFSVVASEIRRLAESSQNGAVEIDEIAAECVEVAQKSGDFLKEIVPKVQKTADLVREISASSKEQNLGAAQINGAIQHLNEVVQQNASTAEELAASSEELHSQADYLKNLVEFFNIHGSKKGFNEEIKELKEIDNEIIENETLDLDLSDDFEDSEEIPENKTEKNDDFSDENEDSEKNS